MNITEHRKNLDKLPPLFQRQRELISKVTPHDQTLRTTLESCASKSEDNIFRVLIMGGFSAGKSSFINALLGEHLLPSFMLPTTAIITVTTVHSFTRPPPGSTPAPTRSAPRPRYAAKSARSPPKAAR